MSFFIDDVALSIRARQPESDEKSKSWPILGAMLQRAR